MNPPAGTPSSQVEDTSWRVEGPQPLGAFVPDGVNDELVQVCIELAGELWVTRRRLAALELQLVEAGLVTSPDRLQSPGGLEDHTERDQFIGRIFRGFVT
jgi:hypothetical protein